MGLGYKTFIPGTLSSSDVQGYLMNQSVITCTSGTRPGTPVTGMTIFETDTLVHRVWSGSGWDNLPGYEYGYVQGSGSVTLATATTDVVCDATTKLTLTLNSQRRLICYARAHFQCATAPARYQIFPAYTPGGAVGAINHVGTFPPRVSLATVGTVGLVTGQATDDVVLAAGTYTFFVGVQRDNGGSATDTATQPQIRVVDGGPS